MRHILAQLVEESSMPHAAVRSRNTAPVFNCRWNPFLMWVVNFQLTNSRCWWNPISCDTHYSGPGLSENDSAVTTDVCEDQNREVGLWGLPLKWNWPL